MEIYCYHGKNLIDEKSIQHDIENSHKHYKIVKDFKKIQKTLSNKNRIKITFHKIQGKKNFP